MKNTRDRSNNIVQETGVFGTAELDPYIGLYLGLYRDAENKSQSGVKRPVQSYGSEGDRRGDGIEGETSRLEGEVRKYVRGGRSR